MNSRRQLRRWLAASLAVHATAACAVAWIAAATGRPVIHMEAGAGGPVQITVTRVAREGDAAGDGALPEPAATETLAGGEIPPPSAGAQSATDAAPLLPTRSERPPLPGPVLSPDAPRALPRAPARAAPGGGAAAGASASATALHCPAPPYPPAARRAGREGAVRLRIVITERGRVADAVILESSGQRDFDEAARRTILDAWTYAPAQRRGQAVASVETVRVEFRLNQG